MKFNKRASTEDCISVWEECDLNFYNETVLGKHETVLFVIVYLTTCERNFLINFVPNEMEAKQSIYTSSFRDKYFDDWKCFQQFLALVYVLKALTKAI